jgi:hypothetical protein
MEHAAKAVPNGANERIGAMSNRVRCYNRDCIYCNTETNECEDKEIITVGSSGICIEVRSEEDQGQEEIEEDQDDLHS